jgi:cysteine desulfurase/selenocysteine lyase
VSSHTAASTYPLSRIRADFPILQTTMRGKPLAYLDNGATSLKPQCVIDAQVEYLTRIGANIHRGVYELSEQATARYEDSRTAVKAFIGAADDGELVFTKSATEASNIVAFSWGRKNLREGDEIVATELEHHANLVPWQQVARETGAKIRFAPLDPVGRLSVSAVESVLGERTRIVVVTGMSNVTGFMPAVDQIARAAHAGGALLVVDGAQLVSHYPVNVRQMDCDFLYFSGHKMCGPTGVGALYGRRELLNEMDPFLYGGDMIVRVSREGATFKEAPERFESGTPNISGVIGFGAAVRYLESIGMEQIAAHEEELLQYAVARVGELPDTTLYGVSGAEPRDSHSGGILSFTLGDIHPHDVGAILDAEGVAVRTGFHCAQPLMHFFGVPGTVRASFYLYNTTEDVDRLVDGLGKARDVFA